MVTVHPKSPSAVTMIQGSPAAEGEDHSLRLGEMPSLRGRPVGRVAPRNQPEWAVRARQLADSLEWVAAQGATPPPHVLAGLDRAWEAWNAGGWTAKDIARVARLIERAHTAIRATPPSELQSAYVLCAEVIHRGLPRGVRARCSISSLVLIVQNIYHETIASVARRQATMRVLGWQDSAERWSERIIVLSLDAIPA